MSGQTELSTPVADATPWHPQGQVSWTAGIDGPYTMRLTFGSWGDLDNLTNTLVENSKRRGVRSGVPSGAALETQDGQLRELNTELLKANLLNSVLAGELKRVADHLDSWARDHWQEATAETWAALHCAREALSQAERGRS